MAELHAMMSSAEVRDWLDEEWAAALEVNITEPDSEIDELANSTTGRYQVCTGHPATRQDRRSVSESPGDPTRGDCSRRVGCAELLHRDSCTVGHR